MDSSHSVAATSPFNCLSGLVSNGFEAYAWVFGWRVNAIRCKTLHKVNETNNWDFFCWRSIRILDSLPIALWS
ncbi:hypothetical protein K7X08_024749 [Anisodus acutangulus]|uniref:Uncharacterized protein n=1 Tax=Anisodus acutangulus TaxID=402998 RepID=A0A9Q1M8Z1_9SOLA|nr:hypothetical protein K7X08_024749 [Anisodus acutangulus]